MKTIGLLGGMSWESSIEYERMINEGVRARLGGTASADLIIRSYNFAAIEEFQESGDWAGAGALLAGDARRLEAAGAELIALCTNTMHVVAPQIEAAIGVPFLHLADTTAAAVTADSKARYLAAVERLVAQGAAGIIAGCTEIELLVAQEDLSVPYFPTTRLHAEAAVAAALA